MAKFYCKVQNERGAHKGQIAEKFIQVELIMGNKDNSYTLANLKMCEDRDGNIILSISKKREGKDDSIQIIEL